MIRLFAMLLFALAPVTIWSQGKPVSPPAESAPIADQQKWLLDAITKYGSYKTPTSSVKISAPKIEACVLSFTQSKKYGATSERTLIVNTRTDTVKEDVSIDLAKLDVSTIKSSEHMEPEVMTVAFRMRNAVRDTEVVVRQSSAEAIKTTLGRVAGSCQHRQAPGF